MGIDNFSGRFGQFVRERHAPPGGAMPPDVPYPLAQETREAIAHHLIPLALLAKSDGDSADAEKAVMLDHAVAILAKTGHPVEGADRAKLKDYIAGFYPTLMQLDPSLHRLEHESDDTKIAFLSAAKALVSADGTIDPAEAHLLEELQKELAKA